MCSGYAIHDLAVQINICIHLRSLFFLFVFFSEIIFGFMSLSFNRTGLLAAIPCMMLTPVLKLKMRFGINDFMLFSLLLFVKQLHHPFNYIRPRYAKYCASTSEVATRFQ